MNGDVEAMLFEIANRAQELKARGAALEAEDVLPGDVVDWMVANRFFKLFVPRALGGAELRLSEGVQIIEALAGVEGNLGWQAQIGSGGGYFVPSFAREVAERVYADPRAVIAGSGAPLGQAKPVPGGYVVSGRWSYASGAQYATLFTANCVLPDGRIRAMAFLPEQVRLIRDWNALGMRATSSWTMEVEEVFVPEELSFVTGEWKWDPGSPVYRVPFDLFATACVGAVLIGLARAFFEEVGGEGRDEAEPFRRLFFTAVAQLETLQAKGALDEAEHRHIGWMMRHAASRSRELVLRAMPVLGMRAIKPGERVSRILRDLLTAGQHYALR